VFWVLVELILGINFICLMVDISILLCFGCVTVS